MNTHSNTNEQNVDDLRIQWAGGRDVWPRVPIDIGNFGNGNRMEHDNINNFISIQTRVKDKDSFSGKSTRSPTDNPNDSINTCTTNKRQWPEIVRESTLFGFGAYNPRGQELPLEINDKQHALLHTDIQNALAQYPNSIATYWEGASVWEDESYEKGFILAFRQKEEQGLELSIELARKYNQGAIYQFQHLEDGDRLMRDTVAVLDEGSDARVEVEIDDSGVDLSPFL
jgi:hypothetical protein